MDESTLSPAQDLSNATLLLEDAVDDSSLPLFEKALGISRRNSSAESHHRFIQLAFHYAGEAGSPALISHLLDVEKAPLDTVPVSTIGSNAPSIDLFKVLVSHGWDVNRRDPVTQWDGGHRLIDFVTHSEEMVRWLLDHGARADGADVAYAESGRLLPRPPPLLESCAKSGTVATLKLLKEHGAELGRRALHLAAQRAALVGVDPYSDASDGDDPEDLRKYHVGSRVRMSSRESRKMLLYLVDELGLDVNWRDTAHPTLALHYGTPINYAAGCPKGASVVRWLLDKGADPHVLDSEAGIDAEGRARQEKCKAVLQVLEAHRRFN